METFACNDHWENVLVSLHLALHQYRLVSGVVQELFHLGGKLGRIGTFYGVNTHRSGEENEVGVVHFGMRITSLIEEI